MKYCLDASALIDLGERHYPERLRVFAPIWNHIYQGIDNGDIISVDYVKTELAKRADDWRTKFFARARDFFIVNEEIEREFANVVREIETGGEFSINKARERFMKGADPWVIALAKSRSVGRCSVVSAETKSLSDYGLGAVCAKLKVTHINLVQFFEANKIGV